MRREAWGHRDPVSGTYDPPHLVDWPAGRYEGRALCGKDLKPVRLDPAGTADRVDVRMCSSCRTHAEPLKRLRGGAQVVELATRRAQRGLW